MRRAVCNQSRLFLSVLMLSLATLGGGLAASGSWSLTGAMNTERWDHTATLLPSGSVLVSGGENDLGQLASAEMYDPSSGMWSSSAAMAFRRRDFTATLLGGDVLVTGGYNDDGGGIALPTAEIWTSLFNGWFSTGSMNVPRYGHTATLLQNGTVLVAGGNNGFGHLASAEIYALGTWSMTGVMSEARGNHTATLLPDGRVLVTGGWDSATSTFLASAEIYDPADGTWSPAGSMSVPRIKHTATLLPNGTVLIAGGHNVNGAFINHLASADIYDPVSGTWSTTGSMNTARTHATATLLPDGTVLVSGGLSDNGAQSGAEIYDPNLGTWSATASMSAGRQLATATSLTDGTVLVTGGHSNFGYLNSAEIYTPPPTDTTPPQVSCGAADGAWHGTDVIISCTATDSESGLANPADASFTLTTNVAAGSETANAATNSRQVCNTKSLCTTAGPITGNNVDKKGPTITVTSPAANATYQLNAVVAANYTCTDGGSGVSSCQGPVASGSAINTSSTGTKTFAVNASDIVGNVSSTSVTYGVVNGGGGGQGSVDLSLTLSAPAKVAPSGTLVYSITVTNRSNTTTANGAVVSDALPPGTVFASASTSQGTITAPAISSNGTVTVNLGSMAGNATANILLNVTVTAPIGATLTDTATVTATTQDLNPNNNSATKSTRVSK